MIRRAAIAIAWALCAPLAAAAAAAPEPALVPNPASLERGSGDFTVSARTPILIPRNDTRARRIAERLAEWIRRSQGMTLAVREGAPRAGAIALRVQKRAGAYPEGYRLEVRPDRVTIVAPTHAGLSHGATTLWQLFAPGNPALPEVAVDDAPRFAWRGILLDSARHYQSPQFIERFLDAMAMQKLNVLHWHLTDDQAWRLEIRKYPLLTKVGAWRVPAGAAARKDIDPATGKPRMYGGFYSQVTVREIVSYAASRGITVVPEIDMPGHAAAVVAAYPRLGAAAHIGSGVPADWGIYSQVLNLDESTFVFLEDVLREVMTLFPGPYIHVGGDEVVTSEWKESPRAQARMSALGIDDVAKVQPYFTRRIGRFLESHGRRLVGWDEIIAPDTPRSAVVMSWRGTEGAITAATQGYDTVLAAHPTLYFDNRQSAAASEPPGRARVVSLEDVYRFEPMPAALDVAQRRRVLGLQGNVWTEHIRTEERVGWMTFPRAAAVAELGWSQPERRDWDDFRRRAAALPARYHALGMPYATSAFATAAQSASQPARTDGAQARTLKSQDLQLCSENVALSLEDDAPLAGPRAAFLVDITNPCWIARGVSLEHGAALVASVGQVPFNFQIGEEVNKIVLAKPTTPEGELEVHLDTCAGELLARLPLAPALASDAVTTLPPVSLPAGPGTHDLCLRFAQPRLDPLWVIDSLRLGGAAP